MLRIVCASFACIRHDDKYALLLDKERSVLLPVGGIVTVNGAAGLGIMAHLSLTPASFSTPPTETAYHLRFLVSKLHEERIRRVLFPLWQSAADLSRKADEALVLRTNILAGGLLSVDLFSGVRYFEEWIPWDRGGSSEPYETLRLTAVYHMACEGSIADRLCVASMVPTPDIYFVSGVEIGAGRTKCGIEIAPIARTLMTAIER